MPDQLNITAAELQTAEMAGNDAAFALLTGRLLASVKSRRTGEHITVQARCRRKDGGRWEPTDFAGATHVFVDVKSADGNGYGDKVGTYYPAGRQQGRFWADRAADPARVWAALFALQFAAGRPVSDRAEFVLGSFCLACGRELTHPDSVRRHLGPDCAQKGYSGQHQQKARASDAPSRPLPPVEAPPRPPAAPAPVEALSGAEDASDVAAYHRHAGERLFEYRPGLTAAQQLAALEARS